MKGIEVETPASLDLTRAAAFGHSYCGHCCSGLGNPLVVI